MSRSMANLFDRIGASENTPALLELLGDRTYKTYAYAYLGEFNLTALPFSIPDQEIDPGRYPFVYLGAGSGFLTKTLWGSVQPDKDKRYRDIERRLPCAHHHEGDVKYHRVSPRSIKLTKLNNRFYEMGKCRLSVAPVIE